MTRLRVLAVAVALALPAVAGLAGAHASSGEVHIMASNDRPRVGELVDFTYFLLDDGELVPHVDTDVTVSQDGAQILHLESTHEHDGVHRTAVRFVEPGPVTVEVTTDGDDPTTATWTGRVVAPDRTVDAKLAVDAPAKVRAGEPAKLQIRTKGPDGPVHHVDVHVRVYRQPDGKLVRRTPLHLHEGEGSLTVTQLIPGDYRIQVEAYPGQGGPGFDPVVVQHELTVTEQPMPVAPQPPTRRPGPAGWVSGSSKLVVAVDPATTVGPLTDVKLDALLLNGTHPVRHVQYRYQLVGPDGREILASENAHAHDGIIELLAHTPRPGTYTWTVHADAPNSGVEATREVSYTVTPPTDPGDVPGTVHPRLPDARAGATSDFALDFVAETGEPMRHVEADVEMYHLGEAAPRWTTKLHAHEKRVEWSTAPARPGPHYLKVNPSPQSPGAGEIDAPGGPTAQLGFAFDVGSSALEAPIPGDAGPAGGTVPLPGVLALAALGAAALLGKRL